MQAIVLNEIGSLESMRLEDRATPTPDDSQVLIEIKAAGASFVDALQASGRYQFPLQAPYIPGGESAGVVTAVGSAVSEWAIGDRVVVQSGVGAFASHIVVSPAQLLRIPDSMDFARASSFIQVYGTAWFAFHHRTVVRTNEVVLITGAGGGVGLAAIDVARSLGARVIAVASTPEKRKLAMQAGAFAALDPNTDDIKVRARELTDGNGIDIVYDVTGGPVAEQALRALRFDGRYLVIGFTAGISKIPLNLVLLNNRTLVGVEWGGWVPRNRETNRAMLEEIAAAIGRGDLRPVAPFERPLAEAADVLRELIERRATGKIVLVP